MKLSSTNAFIRLTCVQQLLLFLGHRSVRDPGLLEHGAWWGIRQGHYPNLIIVPTQEQDSLRRGPASQVLNNTWKQARSSGGGKSPTEQCCLCTNPMGREQRVSLAEAHKRKKELQVRQESQACLSIQTPPSSYGPAGAQWLRPSGKADCFNSAIY